MDSTVKVGSKELREGKQGERERSCSVCESSVKTGPPRRVDCSISLPVGHMKKKASR